MKVKRNARPYAFQNLSHLLILASRDDSIEYVVQEAGEKSIFVSLRAHQKFKLSGPSCV